MAQTRPTGEQLRFVSTRSGSHIMDVYLEAAEKGGRTLADLLEDLFEPSTGELRTDLFQFRVATDSLQVRIGDWVGTDSGWVDVSTFFHDAGNFVASKPYSNLDLVTITNGNVYLVTGLTSGETKNWSSEGNFTSDNVTKLLVDVATVENARLAAENARIAAQTAQTGAQAAQTAAQTARTGAETARTGAEAAKTAAETAKTLAETAQTGAQTAQNGAETANSSAINAKTASQTAQAAAEAAALRAETAIPTGAVAKVGDTMTGVLTIQAPTIAPLILDRPDAVASIGIIGRTMGADKWGLGLHGPSGRIAIGNGGVHGASTHLFALDPVAGEASFWPNAAGGGVTLGPTLLRFNHAAAQVLFESAQPNSDSALIYRFRAAGLDVAHLAGAGPGTVGPQTLMSREKGDARYAQLGLANTFVGSLTVDGNSILVAGQTPRLALYEDDQTLPAGRWRWMVTADELRLQHNTSADGSFGTAVTPLKVTSDNIVTVQVKTRFEAASGGLIDLVNTNGDRGGYLAFYDKTDVRSAWIGFGGNTTTQFSIDAERATELRFICAGSGAMILDTNGNLYVPGGATSNTLVTIRAASASTGTMRVQNAAGTQSRGAVQADDAGTYCRLRKYDSAGVATAYLHLSDDDAQAAAVGTTLTGASLITRTRGDARYTAISSQRYKEEIKDATVNALNVVKQLRPKMWKWGGDVPGGDERRGRVGYGLIAEEVAAIVPPAATYVWKPDAEGKDTTELMLLGLDPMALITLLVDSMQQVEQRTVTLNTRVTALEAKAA